MLAKDRGKSMSRLTKPLAPLAQRFAFLSLVFVAFGIMMVGKADIVVIERARGIVNDMVGPLVDLAGAPSRIVARTIDGVDTWNALVAENARLRSENEQMRQKDYAFETLRQENALLRRLLNFTPEAVVSFVSARVIADQGGSFVRNLLINAGSRQGVTRGQVVVSERGLVGRIVEVGAWTSRVLLTTDLNSRIPVVVESSRWRAVLAGDNSDEPRLLYLSDNARVAVGDRIVTSGHGGGFPPGMPVGIIASVTQGGAVRVRPHEEFQRLEFVRVVSFALDAARVIPGSEANEPLVESVEQPRAEPAPALAPAPGLSRR